MLTPSMNGIEIA